MKTKSSSANQCDLKQSSANFLSLSPELCSVLPDHHSCFTAPAFVSKVNVIWASRTQGSRSEASLQCFLERARATRACSMCILGGGAGRCPPWAEGNVARDCFPGAQVFFVVQLDPRLRNHWFEQKKNSGGNTTKKPPNQSSAKQPSKVP